MIERIEIDPKLLNSDDSIISLEAVEKIMDIDPTTIQDSFYYEQDVPVLTKKMFHKKVTTETLKILVIRFKSEDIKNIAFIDNDILYRKLLNAMAVSNTVKFDRNETLSEYETKCYYLYEQFSRIPRWMSDDRRVINITQFVRITVGDNSVKDNHDENQPLSIIDLKEVLTNSNVSYEYENDIIEETNTDERYDIGVETVDYALKWLTPKGIKTVTRDCLWKNAKCIRLNNPKYIDDPQEFDHIVITENCVIMIETKNYKGKLIIDTNGNWMRELNGEIKGIRNPKQQIERHVDLLKSILPANIAVEGILCLSHPEVLIRGDENTDIVIVRSDLLGDYISAVKEKYQYVSNKYSQLDILSIIDSYKVSDEVKTNYATNGN